jgi:hypothetical protein
MPFSRKDLLAIVLVVVIAALYRVIPYEARPAWLGAPQIAIALFAGSVFRNKKWAFALPLFSMLIGDLLMQGLFAAGATSYPGFYSGQLLNYVLIVGITVVGFFVSSGSLRQVLGGVVAGPTVYFILSNFAVWAGGGGYNRAKTLGGLMQCYVDGLPFYYTSLMGTAIFATVLFGSYYILSQRQLSGSRA